MYEVVAARVGQFLGFILFSEEVDEIEEDLIRGGEKEGIGYKSGTRNELDLLSNVRG